MLIKSSKEKNELFTTSFCNIISHIPENYETKDYIKLSSEKCSQNKRDKIRFAPSI